MKELILGILVFFLGASLASYFSAFIFRVRHTLFEHSPRSHCDHCLQPLLMRDLIPLISYFILRGKCRFCKKPIPFFSFLAEGAGGILAFSLWSML